MKKLFIFAASAALFAACSQSDDLALGTAQQAQAQVEETPVAFDIYVGKSTTRAGVAGDITSDATEASLKSNATKAGKAGFGVFGYYTNDEAYTQLATPNFMYNQQVKYDGTSAWTYSPVKYWPNEFGSEASSNFKDYLSFFAYAPYVDVDPVTGLAAKGTASTDTEVLDEVGFGTKKALYDAKIKTGADPLDNWVGSSDHVSEKAAQNTAVTNWINNYIAQSLAKARSANIVGVSKNTVTGDPFVKYVATLDPTNAVDLLWGVQPNLSGRSSGDGSYEPIQGDYAYTTGMPWLNLTKEKDAATGNVIFHFNHALTKVTFKIDADVNEATISSGHSNLMTGETRIFVRSITFSGFATEGVLDLNNTTSSTPLWLNLDYKSTLAGASTTVYDGRQNGSEMVSANATEKPATLNPVITAENASITSSPAWAGASVGVTNATVNLFAGTNGYVYVIPNGDGLSITIEYDVETIDKSLPGLLSDGITHGSIVKNRITQTAAPATIFEAGKSYTVTLHLGMTSVKFDVDAVEGWVAGTDADVVLPKNE